MAVASSETDRQGEQTALCKEDALVQARKEKQNHN